jgi:lambda family phage portal protein
MGIMNFFFPKPKDERKQARRYQGAVHDRLTASWVARDRAINDELRSDLDALRARSRDMAKNNALARRFLRLVARNIVGPAGVTLQARAVNGPKQPDTQANAAIEQAWFEWGKRGIADVTGRQSFPDLCRSVASAVARDGEALVQLVRNATNSVRFGLRHLDASRLDTRKNLDATGTANAIIMGVEVDQFSRPVAYWIKRKVADTASERFPAADILHVYMAEDAEQVRGIPWMHASMLATYDLGEFTRSAMLNARRSADSLGFLVSPTGTAEMFGDEGGAAEPLKINAPGTYDILPEGYDIRTPEYAYPNQVFEPFTKAIKRDIACGLDVAAHNLTGDMKDVSYSSARIAELEEREGWMTLQSWFIESFVEPVYTQWLTMALTVGVIKMPNGTPLPVTKADKFAAHEWQARRWGWVDPLKDIEAARLAIISGVSSPQQVAAQYGMDIEDVLDSLAAFEAMAKDKGVTLINFGSPSQSAPAGGINGNEND